MGGQHHRTRGVSIAGISNRANGHEDAYNQGRKKEVIQNALAKWRTDLKQVLTAEQAQKMKI